MHQFMNAFTDHRDSELLIIRYVVVFFIYTVIILLTLENKFHLTLLSVNMFILSHFSLLLGCALPIWMSSGYNDRPLAPFAGILSLGIGDTMVSGLYPQLWCDFLYEIPD